MLHLSGGHPAGRRDLPEKRFDEQLVQVERARRIAGASTTTITYPCQVVLFPRQFLCEKVKIRRVSWNEELFRVLEGFPELAHDDEVDAEAAMRAVWYGPAGHG